MPRTMTDQEWEAQNGTAAAPTAAPELDLDTRLMLADAAMTVRLDHAALAFEVNTAHLPAATVEPLTAPPRPTPEPALATPLAACLQRAIRILGERGWTRGHLREEGGAVCAVGAIRAAATSRHQSDDACALLLGVIEERFTAETVPSWNDQQNSAAVIRVLGQVADHAAARGI
ncbi:hypothetical protein ACFU76_04585 [Streptomyces sp. NPDC057539]|uniref:DUF6197 family protein n=1 Tax=Streptomyces sp. NPDC057539 TaxID=3346159 RepID=UPI0036B5E0D7